jgi:hypothetical protein
VFREVDHLSSGFNVLETNKSFYQTVRVGEESVAIAAVVITHLGEDSS